MSRICKLTEENADLKSENESLMEKINNLETEISRINNILNSAKESLAAANAKYEEMSKQLDEKNAENLSLRMPLLAYFRIIFIPSFSSRKFIISSLRMDVRVNGFR